MGAEERELFPSARHYYQHLTAALAAAEEAHPQTPPVPFLFLVTVASEVAAALLEPIKTKQ